jgi:hypothetical protein
MIIKIKQKLAKLQKFSLVSAEEYCLMGFDSSCFFCHVNIDEILKDDFLEACQTFHRTQY